MQCEWLGKEKRTKQIVEGETGYAAAKRVMASLSDQLLATSFVKCLKRKSMWAEHEDTSKDNHHLRVRTVRIRSVENLERKLGWSSG
jgi:hypothetical protein